MARRRKNSTGQDKRGLVLGILLSLLALLLLISLATHKEIDDARVAGEVDGHLNPFDIPYNNQGGMMGAYLSFIFTTLIGWLSFFLPLWLMLAALKLMSGKTAARIKINSIVLFVASMIGTILYNIHLMSPREIARPVGTIGGYIGEQLTSLSLRLLGELGSYVVLSGAILVLLVLYTSITPLLAMRLPLPGKEWINRIYGRLSRGLGKVFNFSWLGNLFGQTESNDDDGEEVYDEDAPADSETDDLPEQDELLDERPDEDSSESSSPSPSRRKTKIVKPAPAVQLKSIKYTYPGLDLLAEPDLTQPAVTPEELEFSARMLRETLETFGVKIDGKIEHFPGPIITRFEFKPAAGIKINRIVSLADDLALTLKAKRIRIIAPIPGKAAVGVEIPNRHPQMVYLRDVFTSSAFNDSKLILPIALGKSTSGQPIVADLTTMPHLLVAGATGSGKSVCMNVLITSLLFRLHPHQVRFIMIDPKMLELSIYKGIPHLGRPVVTKPKRAEKVLAEAVVEMEHRYRKLAEASVRNIADFNKRQTREEDKLPYIVIFVDELADLMMSSNTQKTEMMITRLAQMSRAVGIHLILATQRPSVDVITGLIKANFPARIAFQVSSKVDSRTIIDANGAERLLGKGDMLYLPSGQPEPVRIHGPYISSEETEGIVQFIKDQGLEMFTLENISQASGEPTEADIDTEDPLFREACNTVVRHKQGSVSLLQRRLGIGYQRAARLIDRLEQAGIVSKFDGSKAREVLVDQAYVDALFSGASAVETSHQNG
ncbi:MAG TPA: DNA translocase FtsK 4TM domain-containing protein [candidate division Zixibacteria bacterium]|nr:DNA translocase FtsK 4TM domain-containing protein [candidate division Zixibacteria bacterium]